MENKKDIGKAFKEKLSGLHKSPGDHIWQSIRQDLPKRNRWLILPLWFRASVISFAALLFIAFFTFINYSKQFPPALLKHDSITTTSRTKQPEIIERNDEKNSETNIRKNSVADEYKFKINDFKEDYGPANNENISVKANNIKKIKTSANNDVANSTKNRVNKFTDKTKSKSNRKYNIGNIYTFTGIREKKTEKSVTNKNDSARVRKKLLLEEFENNDTAGKPEEKKFKQSFSDYIQDNELSNGYIALNKISVDSTFSIIDTMQIKAKEIVAQLKVSKEADTINSSARKMFLYAFAAPVYIKPKDGNYIDTSLSGKDVSTEKSFSYGLYLGYNINSKWSVRAGIVNTKIELALRGAALANTYIYNEPSDEFPDGWLETVTPSDYTGIAYTGGVSNNTIRENLGTNMDEMQELYGNINIRQTLEYLELPVEAIYNIYNNKFSIGILGGFNTRLLINNKLYAENENGSIYLGSYKESKKLNFAITAGVNISYKITPSLQINFDPVVRYNFDAFNTKPFIMVLQGGLQYNFNFKGKEK